MDASPQRSETPPGGASSSSWPNGPGRSASWPSCTGLRQPQTTKHLQTLARAGLVAVFPLGQRRVYALEPAAAGGVRATGCGSWSTPPRRTPASATSSPRYRTAIEAESAVADRERWADGRTFAFDRDAARVTRCRLAALGRPRTCSRPGGRRRR